MSKTEITTAETLEIVRECVSDKKEVDQHLEAYLDGEQCEIVSLELKWFILEPYRSDIQFYRRTPTHIINGFEVPVGVGEPVKFGGAYYYEAPYSTDFYDISHWGNYIEKDSILIRRGLIHTTKEAAVASCKARLGIDPYEEEGK